MNIQGVEYFAGKIQVLEQVRLVRLDNSVLHYNSTS